MSMISHQIEELRGYAEAWQGMDVSRAIYGAIDIIEALSAKIREQNLGCTDCEHYDQQETAMICRDCRRYYKDKHSEYRR